MGSSIVKFCECSEKTKLKEHKTSILNINDLNKDKETETRKRATTSIETVSEDMYNSKEFQVLMNHTGDKATAKKVTSNDFQIERELGRGAFGKVFLVTKKDKKNKFYAMKVIKKTAIYENNLTENIVLEKTVLQTNHHPYVVTLYYAFQNKTSIYLVMEYLSGGDIFHLLRRQQKFTEDTAKFYLAEVVMAVDYLHREMNLIYRDLKPENILLHANGNIKITDFGLSKQTDGTTYTLAGTPEYLAPEILEDKGHTKAIDWWSVGILLYELLTGHPPFTNKERNMVEIKRMIIENKPKFPSYFSKNAIDIIKKFLDSDPSKRLGVRSIADVKKHPFFNGINWDDLMQLKVQPPIFTKKIGPIKPINPFPDPEPEPVNDINDEQYLHGFTYMPDPITTDKQEFRKE